MAAGPSSAAVLARIAARENLDPADLYLEAGAVFWRSPDGLRTLCQVGTEYWLNAWSELMAESVIASARWGLDDTP